MTISFRDQMDLAKEASNLKEGVTMMNAVVTPCEPKPKFLGIFNRSLHRFEDHTRSLNTMTYTVLLRCKDCGYMELKCGL